MSGSNGVLSDVENITPCQFCESVAVDEDGYCAECGLWRASGESVSVEQVALPTGEIYARLIVPDRNAGEGLSRSIDLPEGVYTVGRADADIVVGDPFVSRTHAELRVSPGGIVVVDKGSTNGTFIDGQRMTANIENELRIGNSLRFGQTDIQWEFLGKPLTVEVTAIIDSGESVKKPEEEPSPVVPATEDDAAVAGDGPVEETAEGGPTIWKLKCANREMPEIGLKPGKTVIGRKAGRADAVVTGDGFISSAHLSVEINDDGVFVTDMASTNGTLVNDARLEPSVAVKVESGDRIRIGETEFVIEKNEIG